MKKIFLSYVLSPKTPAYGNGPSLQMQQVKNMACGDSCNQFEFSMNNHLGTHVDCPHHFDANGKKIDEYPAEFWFFEKCFLLEVFAKDAELIDLSSWISKIPSDVEFLIVKTGFCHRREESVYWQQNPGMAPISGVVLRQNFPKLKAIGLDLISLSSYQHRAEGRVAHKEFLEENKEGAPILIIEDMDLRYLESSPSRVFVSPLRIEGLDGSPVTILAEI
jgi:arylformamidase